MSPDNPSSPTNPAELPPEPVQHSNVRVLNIRIELYESWTTGNPDAEEDNFKDYRIKVVKVNGVEIEKIDGNLPLDVWAIYDDDKAGYSISLEAGAM